MARFLGRNSAFLKRSRERFLVLESFFRELTCSVVDFTVCTNQEIWSNFAVKFKNDEETNR